MKQGWEIKKLGDVASFKRGLTYSKKDEVEYSKNCILRSNNIELETMSILFDELKYIREDFVINDDKKVKSNTILICMSNGSKQHIGKVAFIDKEYDYAFGGFMGLIKPNPDIFPKFLFYSCISSSYKQFLAGVGNGANITNIKFSDLSEFKIPIPPLAEQERIVAELDCLSGIIEKKKEQLKQLDALAQSIFYEMFGNPIDNEKGWEVHRIGELAEFCNGTAHEGDISEEGKYKVINSKFISSNGDICKHCNLQIYPLYQNDIVMVMSDVPNGKALAKCYIINENNKYTLNQRICAFRNYNLDTIFLYYCLNRNPYYLSFNNGNSQTNLRKNDVLNCPIITPPLSLQQAFASKIEAIEKQKELIKQSIKEVETLFNSRMDYYFN